MWYISIIRLVYSLRPTSKSARNPNKESHLEITH